jgi:excisionase family DNA binding protein
MSPADRPALSVAETAELLGISRWLVQQAVRDSSLPSVRVGRRILIPRVQLDAWLNGQQISVATPIPDGALTETASGTRRAYRPR